MCPAVWLSDNDLHNRPRGPGFDFWLSRVIFTVVELNNTQYVRSGVFCISVSFAHFLQSLVTVEVKPNLTYIY